ncbi:hypothetical protein [Pseudomonas koreensis]|uniref:hypothetical protein n=1 Tax=Pseudomonas koreensis TaxID=198620 RepID=UPI003F859700
MRITEASVIKAARDWSAKNDRDAAKTVNEAEDTIGSQNLLATNIRLEGIYQRCIAL